MFRFTRVLRSKDRIVYDSLKKSSTGIAGVPVIANSRQILSRVYTSTIEKAEDLPSNIAFKGHIISLCRHRLNAVMEESDIEKLERRLNCGQVEELVAQAEWEYKLVSKMVDEKEWENVNVPDPTSIPIGLINHENFEGSSAENRASYYSIVSDLADEEATATPFTENSDETSNIKDAYSKMLYHIYEKPRKIFGEEVLKSAEHLNAPEDTANKAYEKSKND